MFAAASNSSFYIIFALGPGLIARISRCVFTAIQEFSSEDSWLATGGKSCINDRLLVLKGRKIIAFPDIDGFNDWTEKLAKYPDLGITVSPILNQNATAEDLENHIDIADWLIRYKTEPAGEPVKKHSVAFLRAARFLDPSMRDEIEALIDDLGLEFLGAETVEEPEEPP